ncbi:LOW QUALITY PROTEIN: olfactory receptor 2A2-like [Macaca thibetana thibetana]|uniref:LOW QUALITY PROTEIN: olfactory receptor 2A2-like n=1 Tax=Macaca thibetana thibetana TaxID=257877 RepID=UPI0021BCB349|nr:LOW QUALITY PROTEIN: olfactory receptor 2A2-like [Macaca thibetana thibetana]
MEDNQSRVTEFILVGFQLSMEMEVLLFWIFSLLYLFSLLANGMIFGLICVDPRLRTPMYFFLSHLAVIDISYASSNLLNMLKNLVQHKKKTISFISCIRQMALYLTFAAAECLILVVMSYDRFVTICHSLHYTIMNWRVCTVLAVTSWACGFSLTLINLILLLRLPFCGPQEVNRFFCEILSVLKLACADTWINEIFVFAGRVFVLVRPLSLMLISYMRILLAILKIQSEDRRKAFSTCSSHLCVVGLYFGIDMVVYLVPDNSQRQEQEKILTLFYSLFNPLLNPLIYSLRNAQVKGALYRALQKKRTM